MAGAPVDDSSFPPFEPSHLPAIQAGVVALPALSLVEGRGDRRRAVEALIRERFAMAYGARISQFMPRLFSLHRDGLPFGAFGLREAGREGLFLERYLDQPIELAIAAGVGRPVAREAIVEVGQFVGTGVGAFRSLIVSLTERLAIDGYHWVVFTGTGALRNAFHRLGLQPRRLGLADPARLSPDELAGWGTYYQHSPCVMFGDIREGHAAILAAAEGA